MWNEEMSAVRGEGDVSRGDGGNKMIFGCNDCSFRGVGAVVSGRDVLELDAGRGLLKKVREFLTRLIVENEMNEGMEMGEEETACRLEGRDIGRRSA
jgi:hypothetical protein